MKRSKIIWGTATKKGKKLMKKSTKSHSYPEKGSSGFVLIFRNDRMVSMDTKDTLKNEENRRAIEAAADAETKNAFLAAQQGHILHLTARVLKRTVTMSDDEWSIALIAVSEALDSYDESRGNFWNYAALVIGSRLKDHFRSAAKDAELLVGPDAFDGDPGEDDPAMGLKIEVRDKTAVVVDTALRDEIEAFGAELREYGIDLFDLPESAPRAAKTRAVCAELIKAFFTPPPLTDELKRTKNLPVKSMLGRVKVARKLIDRHRKYLVAAMLIKAGDYPGMADYLPS